MAILSQNVLEDIRTAEVMNFEPLPEGKYTVKVDATDLKSTKNGTGQYIKVEFVVLGPRFQGRKLFANHNIVNDSAESMRIGRQQVKSLMVAGGMSQEQINRFNDTDQLLGLTVNVRVGVDEGSGQYGPQNRIKGYEKAASITPPPTDAFAAPSAAGGFDAAFTNPAVASTSNAASTPAWFK